MASAAANPPPPPPPPAAPAAAAAAPLRRAAYVNVDDLVRAQYDVNLERLADELARLTAKRGPAQSRTGEGADDGGDGTGSVPASPDGASAAAATGSSGARPGAWGGANLAVLPARTSALPPYSKHHHQSRLQPPRDGFNLCLLVGKVELVVDKYRVDGSRVLVAEVEVGDETGSISLRARDEQIDLLRQVSNDGGAIVLRNCTMELYQGKHLRLAVSKWGKMTPYPDGIESTPDPPSSMNQELNFSLVDLNIVARTKMPDEPPFPMPVATVHHKPQKQKQHAAPKHVEETPGTPKYRGRGHYSHMKKQYHHRQQHQQHTSPGAPHNMNSSDNQYLLQHQQRSGGSANSPTFQPQMHYQQYGDASNVYSYPSQQGGEQQQAAGSPHRQFLPNDHYKRQQQILYQQYELQQRHAHQMHMLQQQQESQRRMLEQQQQQIAHSSLIPDLGRVESHESGADFSPRPPPGGGGGMGHPPPPPPSLQLGPPPPPGPFPPAPGAPAGPSPPQHPAMGPEYPYASLVPSPMGNVFQGEGVQQQQQQQQHQNPRSGSGGGGGLGGMPTYATIISPPMSPAHPPRAESRAPPQYPGGRLDGQYGPENQD